MDKYTLGATQFAALILTVVTVKYLLDIPVDDAHAAAIGGTAVVIFSVVNFIAQALRWAISRRAAS